MNGIRARVLQILLPASVGFLGLPGQADDALILTSPEAWTVTRDEAWGSWLDRSNGWLGADGIYSISLSERDDPGSGLCTSNLVIFSDTFVGNADGHHVVQPGWRMPRNTAALIPAGVPDPARIPFFWGTDAWGSATSLFAPSTSTATNGEWYWPCDGLTVSGVTHIFALRMGSAGEGVWGFETHGVALLSSPSNAPLDFNHYQQQDAPLRYDDTNDTRGEILLGAAVMANTAAAGALHPDGYVYVYGHQNDPFNKKLVAARVRPDQLRDFPAWRFWSAGGWTTELAEVTTLAERISSEFSISPLPDGRFALTVERDTLGPDVCVSIGESPVGPFGPYHRLWTAPEVTDSTLGTQLIAYNAKAHPQLSRPGELLITYNLNSLAGDEILTNISIYRPRFLRARMECVIQSMAALPDHQVQITWLANSNTQYELESRPLSSDSWTRAQLFGPSNSSSISFPYLIDSNRGALFRLKWATNSP